MSIDNTKRVNIQIGKEVEVVQKQDQRSGKTTSGVVKRILTNSAFHPTELKLC
jgi:uncharacterized repeat protein (TIGR03833 family)